MHMQKAFSLENMLKNVAIRQIVMIRESRDSKNLMDCVKDLWARKQEEMD